VRVCQTFGDAGFAGHGRGEARKKAIQNNTDYTD
jgi:hypothetical protein